MEELRSIMRSRIYEIRGVRLMPDFDPEALYQMVTRPLNQTILVRK